MKKQILLIAMLISIACTAQNGNYAKIQHTSSDTIYPGDSAYVDIFYYYAVPQGFTAMVNLQVSASLDFIDSFTFRHLDSVPHVQVFNPINGLYVDCARVSFVVPPGVALGQTFYYCNSENYPVFIGQHLTTNITSTQYPKQIKEVRYYNLIGQETNALKGLIIERTFYADNSMAVKKVWK